MKIQLGPRLALCARLVREGAAVADIGTDHGYLPIWLIQAGKISRAVAGDVNPGPLETARRNARRAGVEGRLRLALGDGLEKVGPEDADDVVIAGMGGELILRIVSGAGWLRDPEKRLVLQPMSAVDKLRVGLWRLGFQVLEEFAVEDSGKAYSAFSARYAGELPPYDRLYPYMGALRPGDPAVERYAVKTVRGLMNQLRGAEHEGDGARAEELRGIIEGIAVKYSHNTNIFERKGEQHG